MTHSVSYRRILNRMGYYAYQNGLIYNHLNQEGGWDSHLVHCRDFITRALDYYKPERVTVLGSGWLLDLPLAEMLEKTQTIYLVDIIHPPEVIRQAGTMKNVTLVELDITGGLIEGIWQKTGSFSLFKKKLSSEALAIPEFEPSFDPGMVISLNIMTQLEAQLIDWLKKKSNTKEEDLSHFKTGIQNSHINFLLKHRSVLITDYAEVVSKRSGETLTIRTLLADVPSARFTEEWTWNFDLRGRDFYNSRSVIKVMAAAF